MILGLTYLEWAGLASLTIAVLKAVDFLITFFPKLVRAKVSIINFLSTFSNHHLFKREAIKSDIEATVNEVVFQLQSELPVGWIKRASIKWVRDLNRKDKAPEGEMILRVRPVQNQNVNLIFAVKTFFKNALFPDVMHIVPSSKFKAAVSLLTRRAVVTRTPALKEVFNKTLLETEIQADENFLRSFNDFERLDNFGFFSSALLREVASVADGSLYDSGMRTNLDTEINQIVNHMKAFTRELGSEKGRVSEAQWSRIGPVNSYSFLLVAHPNVSGVSPYVTRVEEKIVEGVTRIYVLAKNEQRDFAKKVIRAIVKQTQFEVEDSFSLHKDYRCNLGGYGAVLVVNEGLN